MKTGCLLSVAVAAAGLVQADVPNYEDHIRPLFRDHCLKCHNADDANADLDLSSFAAVVRGGASGPVVKAGRPESSQLYRAMAHLDGAEPMPPESPKLKVQKLTLVRDWIRGGLVAARGGKSRLRAVGAMIPAAAANAAAPLPMELPDRPLTVTRRPPVPQAMAASPGAPLLAVSGEEQIFLYAAEPPAADLESQGIGRIGVLPFSEGAIHDLKFSRSGTVLLAAGGRGAHSGRVVLFDVRTGKQLGRVGDEVDSVLAADISQDHATIALGGPARIVKLFDTRTGDLRHRMTKHTDWITAVSFSPDGKMLATGDRSGGVRVWETDNGAIVFTLGEHKVRITGLAWRADGKILATAADDGNLILWDMKDGFPAINTAAHTQKATSRYTRRTGVTALQYAGDGRLLTAGRDGTARLWSADGSRLLELTIPEGLPVSAVLLNGGHVAAVGSLDGSVQLWDLSAGARTQLLMNGQLR